MGRRRPGTAAGGECVGPDLTVRPLRAAEGRALGPLFSSVDPWKTLGYRPEALSAYLLKRGDGLERFGFVQQGRVVGVVCVRFPWLRGPFVEFLAVLPERQGAGIGQAVLGWVEANPRWPGANVWVTVSSFHTNARRFYQRSGYREVAALPRLVAPDGEEVLLRKEAAPRGAPARPAETGGGSWALG